MQCYYKINFTNNFTTTEMHLKSERKCYQWSEFNTSVNDYYMYNANVNVCIRLSDES